MLAQYRGNIALVLLLQWTLTRKLFVKVNKTIRFNRNSNNWTHITTSLNPQFIY